MLKVLDQEFETKATAQRQWRPALNCLTKARAAAGRVLELQPVPLQPAIPRRRLCSRTRRHSGRGAQRCFPLRL